MELYNQYKDKSLNKYNSIIFNILKTLGISYKTNGANYIKIIVLSEIKCESEILNLNNYYIAIAKNIKKVLLLLSKQLMTVFIILQKNLKIIIKIFLIMNIMIITKLQKIL